MEMVRIELNSQMDGLNSFITIDNNILYIPIFMTNLISVSLLRKKRISGD